jgi:NAD(P)-dependent dehydrogenase (short-subunit alcohol dehydrogenase family)
MALNPRLASWPGLNAWIVGGSSGIGRATASALHARGAKVTVSARDADALAGFVAGHPGSVARPLDVLDRAALADAAGEIAARGDGRIDLVLYSAGYYRPMRGTAFDLEQALRHVRINQIGALHLLDALLPRLLRQRGGHLSLVGSVAGFRGLPNALGYGPTKAALINLAEGLYLDLAPHGIGVSIVNPGFVRTPMTEQNEFDMPALIDPSEAAEAIIDGWQRGRFEIHFPKRFTRALKALRLLPDGLYFRAIRRITGL